MVLGLGRRVARSLAPSRTPPDVVGRVVLGVIAFIAVLVVVLVVAGARVSVFLGPARRCRTRKQKSRTCRTGDVTFKLAARQAMEGRAARGRCSAYQSGRRWGAACAHGREEESAAYSTAGGVVRHVVEVAESRWESPMASASRCKCATDESCRGRESSR